MERSTENMERPATKEEREYVNRALFQYGLYSAALDEYPTDKRTDEKWAYELDINHDIIKSNN